MVSAKETAIMKKFNPKVYKGKDRLYSPVQGTVGIQRLWFWNDEEKEYRAPERGKIYEARRYDATFFGGKKRVTKYFETLDEARAWQAHLETIETLTSVAKNVVASATPETEKKDSGPTFKTIVDEWKSRMYPTYGKGTCIDYDKIIRLNFDPLMPIAIRSITPKAVDEWIDWLRASITRSDQARRRQFFTHELRLLTGILNYYREYYDDRDFFFPVKKRHRSAVKLRREFKTAPKDLPVSEFMKFRDELLQGAFGVTMAAMATVQYFQALRISEAAALHFEDLLLDFHDPVNSRLRVVRHVVWIRKAGVDSYIEGGFKNAKANGGIKEQPIFPETYQAIQLMLQQRGNGTHGLLFMNDEKTFFTFRQIQNAYNRAFARANLPYSGTHVLRHGGTRNYFNKANGDLAIAQQILGNTSLDSTLVYAKRNTNALNQLARKEWETETPPTPPKPMRHLHIV